MAAPKKFRCRGKRKAADEDAEPRREPGPFGTPGFFSDAQDDEEDMKRLVKVVEAMARKSMELRDYIRFLKDEVKMDHCHFFTGVSAESVDVELHHHPLTLFDITEAVVRAHMCGDRGEVSSVLMAQEVVRVHYDGRAGLVPLSKTAHELVHAGKLHVPPEAVWGDVAAFVGEYRHHLGAGVLEKLDRLCSVEVSHWSVRNAEVLAERPVYNPRPALTEDGVASLELPEPARVDRKDK
jgi:hypothetical protein